METCPRCKRTVPANALICTYCGGLLVDERRVDTTRTLANADNEESDQRWGTARFSDRMNLVLRLDDLQEQFVFDAEAIGELILGRFDASTQFSPEVDLQAYGATDKGVSRRHASIIRRDGALHIVDLDTPNGTYLNGQRLIPHQARVLRDGDNIRLGHLVLQVQFVRFATPA